MNWRKLCICTLMTTNIFISSAGAMDKPVTIVDQGSFFAGGTVIQVEGNRDFYKPTKPEGQTLHGDHAYVFYQKPQNAHKYPLVFYMVQVNLLRHGKLHQMVEMVFKIYF